MADEIIFSPEQQEAAERLTNTILQMKSAFGENNQYVQQLSSMLESLASRFPQLSSVIDSARNSFINMTNSAEVFGSGAVDLGRKILTSLTPTLESLGNTIDGLAPIFATKLADPIAKVGSSIDGLISAFGNVPMIGAAARKLGELEGATRNLLQVQTTAREAAILQGLSIQEAGDRANAYTQGLRQASLATGITGEKLQAMNQVMRVVPNALRDTTEGLGSLLGAQEAVVQPTAVLATVLRGMGISAEEAGKIGVEGFLKFGQSAEDTIRQVGLMAGAVRGLDHEVRSVAVDQIRQASSNLAIFGQRSASAAATWRTFRDALQDTSVPLEAIGTMVNQLTGSIANMSLQNRAFISMMSGMGQGAGALGGGLRMELAMRSPEGMQQNLEALTQSIGRLTGGEVLTIEQAVDTGQEQQFILQRQMLGQLTGINNQEQQNRILRVLQQVQEGGMSQVQGGEALKDTFEKGRSIQEQQLTAFQRLEQTTRAGFGRMTDAILLGAQAGLRGRGAMIGSDLFERAAERATRGEYGAEDINETFRQFGASLRDIPGTIRGAREEVPERERASLTGMVRALGAGVLQGPRSMMEPARQPRELPQRAQQRERNVSAMVAQGDERKLDIMNEINTSIQQLATAREEGGIGGEKEITVNHNITLNIEGEEGIASAFQQAIMNHKDAILKDFGNTLENHDLATNQGIRR